MSKFLDFYRKLTKSEEKFTTLHYEAPDHGKSQKRDHPGNLFANKHSRQE